MWSSAQALVNYGEAVGTMIVAGALVDWSLADAQRRWLADRAVRIRALIGALRRRRLLDLRCRPQGRRSLIALVCLCDAALFCHLARRINYHGTSGIAHDIVIGDLLLFVLPLGVAAWALVRRGPLLVTLLLARDNLPACWAKCAAAALAAGLVGYGALAVLNATLRAFGPRAVLDWWDARLWLFAAEHAAWGVIVSAMMIGDLLVALLGAAGLALLAATLTMMQIELLARIVARYPRRALLGSSIAVAGLAIVINDWM
jgi:hypothetical protein